MTDRIELRRAVAALKNMFVADALAMPVHWYYNPLDIERAFPGGISGFEAAPECHPSSIMALHSTAKGGRGQQKKGLHKREIVGDVILRGRRERWGIANQHYHQGMQAGENTLNAHCARVVLRSLAAGGGCYDKDRFLDAYIAFMTACPPQHPDTYAESYHRGFFANLEAGKPKNCCAAVTHDTPSIGGLVTIAPILLAGRLRGRSLLEIKDQCLEHLFLTHPDKNLGHICTTYVELLDALLFRNEDQSPLELLAGAAKESVDFDLPALIRKNRDDRYVVGKLFSSACYIDDSWPSVLYLAYKYYSDQRRGLLVNTNLGGDNVHRGIVLGTLLGLINAVTVNEWFVQLVDHQPLIDEITALLSLTHSENDSSVLG